MEQRSLLRAFALGAAMLGAMPALAAADDPVKSIMDLASALWSDNPPENKDYFDKDHIGLFSKSFVAAYRETEKYPVYEEGGSPFGYDVITNSQEGCPLKDLVIAPGAEAAGTTDVKVTFKLMACYDDDPGKDAVSEVHFKVVTEDGKPVISDIDRIIDGKPASLMAEMKDIVKAAQEAPADQQEPQQ
jgi:hypothetical protein